MRTRQIIAQRLNKIRHFRNRIFHHETIWHFRDISHAHDDIMETIGWMSREMRQVVGIVDGFPRVCQHSYQEELKQKLLNSIT